MAVYTIPQDVETEDKILGPFGFRQFIYLLITVAMVAAAYGLFLIAPILVVLPLPVALFFLIIALPLKKEQPMETYVGALIRFYFKPQSRRWISDGQESFVKISEEVKHDAPPVKDFTGEEAEQRITFLSDIIDSHGWKTRGVNGPESGGIAVNDDLKSEADQVVDMFDTAQSAEVGSALSASSSDYHDSLLSQMKNNYVHETALDNSENSATIRGNS
jgi:hypothetical protein